MKNNQAPLISVVMPVYNCEAYVKAAIDSILSQTYTDFEFIIINDGSTDRTLVIVNAYAAQDPRIKVIDQPNGGIVAALNRGIAEAKGEWIFRMDGDDISLPHRFALQVEAINDNPAVVLWGGWCQQINTQGILLKTNKFSARHKALVHRLATLRPFFPHPAAAFRRDGALRSGGYREKYRNSQDADLWLRMADIGELGCVQEVVIRLRKHDMNVSSTKHEFQHIMGMAAVVGYFRRQAGLADPAQMEEGQWQDFLRWITRRMQEDGYFQRWAGWLALYNRWHADPEAHKLRKVRGILTELLTNPLARKGVVKLFYKGESLPRRLAAESEKIFSR
jgi:glycosyltransferase involved in cell wall biosynthesis